MIRRPMCLVCLILMLFLCFADWLGLSLISGNPLPKMLQDQIEEHPETTLYGEVEACTENEFSQSIYLKHSYILYHSKPYPIENVNVFLKEKQKSIVPAGTLLVLSGRLEKVPEMRNPGEFDSRQYYACEHVYYFLKKAKIRKRSETFSRYKQWMIQLKNTLRQVLKQTAGSDAGIFSSMVLGDKSDLEKETRMLYQMSGIVHMLAISGLHISVLGMGIYQLFMRTGMGIWPSGILSLLLMLQYGILTGESVSTMRAIIMFLLSIGAKMTGRIYDMLTAMAVAAMLLLLDTPAYLYSSGFLLSFGAVVGIGVVSPVLSKGIGVSWKGMEALLGSIAVQLVTLPIMLYFYGEVSMTGIFLNLLVLPTVGIVLGSGVVSAALGCFWIPAGRLAALPGRVLLAVYGGVCRMNVKLPFCTWIAGRPGIGQILIYYGILAAILWIFMRKKTRWWEKILLSAALIGECFLLHTVPSSYLKIACLDVGQGDGIVIETPDGGCYLSDFGSSNKNDLALYQLLPYLKCQGISRINGILVSHTDGDHISGIQELLTYLAQGLCTVRVDALYLPDWEKKPVEWKQLEELAGQAGVNLYRVQCGNKLVSGDLSLEFLAPESGAKGEDVNEDAAVFILKYGSFKGIFTGDIGAETEEKLIKKQLLTDVDFLKTGHHGSRFSSSEDFLKAITPEYAVISCSATNTYGHPAEETVKRLEEAGAQIYYTMKNGVITLYTDGVHVKVKLYITDPGDEAV